MQTLMRPTVFALILLVGTGCATLLAKIVPSHNQSFDASDIPSGRYSVDHPHASVHFRVDHMGYSDYLARFNSFDGAIEFNNLAPENSKLGVIIRADSIDSNSDVLDKELRGGDFFNVKKFPEMTFTAEGVEITGETSGVITGEMTILGITRPLQLDVIFNGGARNMLTSHYTLGFSATGTLNRSDYGMKAYIPLIGDEVRIDIEAEFRLE